MGFCQQLYMEAITEEVPDAVAEETVLVELRRLAKLGNLVYSYGHTDRNIQHSRIRYKVVVMNLYDIEPADFYERQAESRNPVRRWFHQHRHELVRQLVLRYFHGGYIMDIGCGNCVWNTHKLPVIGVDGNAEALSIALKAGRLHKAIQADVTQFEVVPGSINLIVISEVLEHIQDFRHTMRMMYQSLEHGGHLIVTVPYDVAVSLWRPLFLAQCIYQGHIKGDGYYKARCGHVHHFSMREMVRILQFYGFRVTEQFNMRGFTIFTVGRKEAISEQARDIPEVSHRAPQKVLLRGRATASAKHSRAEDRQCS